MQVEAMVTLLLMLLLALVIVGLYYSKRYIGHVPFYVFAGALTLFFQLYTPHFLVNFSFFTISPLWITVLPALFSMLLLVQQNEGKRAADSMALGLIVSYVFSGFFTMILRVFVTPQSQYLQPFLAQYSSSAFEYFIFDAAVFAAGITSSILFYRFLHHRMWGRAASLILSLWSALLFTLFISPFKTLFPVIIDPESVESYLFGVTIAALVFGTVLFAYYYFFGWEADVEGHS